MQISEGNFGKSGNFKKGAIEFIIGTGAISIGQCEATGVEALSGIGLIYGKSFDRC